MTTNSVRVDDVDLHFVDSGSGDPLLLVHGYTGSVLDWAEVIPELSRSRRVLAYDHRGHGRSTNTGDPSSYTIDRLVSDLDAFVCALDLPAFHLLGHSMGGVVAQRYILDHPERVRSALLMDTAPALAGILPAGIIENLAAVGREHGMGAVFELVRPALETVPGSTLARVADDRRRVLLERLEEKYRQLDPEAFLALAKDLEVFPSMIGRLGEISCPVTVIVGERDAPDLRAGAEILAAGIDGAELKVIPGAGHCPQEDRPEEWLAAVQSHFDHAVRAAR